MPKSPRSTPDLFTPDGRLSFDLFVECVHPALRATIDATKQTKWDCVRSPHLFMGLLSKPDADVVRWADDADLEITDLLATLHEMFYEQAGDPSAHLALHREFLSDNCLRFLRGALRRALAAGRKKVTSIDLLVCLLTDPESIIIECLNLLDLAPKHLATLAAEMDAL